MAVQRRGLTQVLGGMDTAKRLYRLQPDFLASITLRPGCSNGHDVMNGARTDFCYVEDPDQITQYMIWPDFFDASGDSLPTDQPLVFGIPLNARMHILSREFVTFHMARLRQGTRFYCMAGPQIVGDGVVTDVFTNPA